ncbi:hypothetical protein BDN71DRAFT_1434166 [Pleurotus eryngii]|uniref:Uncharacterized protein n=1 Tax=Pleurotus eryngii TaxID=5323 RepID=A0A9P6D3F9_PLEER|nr:hypothetical protein BDN71DRAFT_1434166 [Pleurotus eryngii]
MHNQLMNILKTTIERYTTPLPDDATDAQKAVPKATETGQSVRDSDDEMDVGDYPDNLDPVTLTEALGQVLKPYAQGILVKEENKALQRLLSGYAEFTSQDEADCLWKPYMKAGVDWIDYCE